MFYDCSVPHIESVSLSLYTAPLFVLKRCKDLNGKRVIPKWDLCGQGLSKLCVEFYTDLQYFEC